MLNTDNNLILFHLESLNTLMFQLHPELFTNLRKIIEKSTYFSNFYSTATSTNMVITDLFFGDSSQFENVKKLKEIFSAKVSRSTLFEKLDDNGYYTKQFYYCYCDGDSEDLRDRLCKKSDYWLNENPVIDEFSLEFEKSVSVGKKFAFFIHDDESHISHIHQHNQRIQDKLSNDELFLYRFKQLDNTVGNVFSVLEKTGKLRDTIVVLYGDHGDDFFSHGMHDGYFHAIEPYSFITHCPLIVYIPEGHGAINDKLISTVDIYNMALHYLDLIDCNIDNKFVFSRNLFSKQDLCKKSFNKSYSVTNGSYSLIVSNDGLKMYNNRIDVLNGKNILDLFRLNNCKLQFISMYDFYTSNHIKSLITEKYKKEICDAFTILHKELVAHVKSLYNSELGKMNFFKIDYSIEKYKIGYNELYHRRIMASILNIMPRSWKDRLKRILYS